MAISKSDFTETARKRISEALPFWHNWRAEALDEYAFISGRQWLAEDQQILEEQKRPPITFNYSEKMIDAVVGAEVSNRQEVTYKPRGVEDSALAELWNNAAKWAREETNAEDEESDAFRDMLICGMGWTQTRMSYDEDQDGQIKLERIDPLEMLYDPAASKPGVTDRRWNARMWWVDRRDAEREWPSQTIFDTMGEMSDSSSGVVVQGRHYDETSGDDGPEWDKHKDQVQILHYECVELEPIYRVALQAGVQEMSVTDFNSMKQQLDETGIKNVKQQKRVYYRGFFAGETLLEMELSPCQNGFTFQAITGKRDRNKNCFYGLTRVMKDPQRWANKWLSQILFIINSNAKGGLLAEIGAFVDPVKAQEEWAQSDSITLLRQGALSGGMIKEKGVAQYPSGLDKLMQFALGSLPMVTGINLEALGLANREQAGVLEQQRKQAAYGLLSPLFDSLRRYRKESGRILLYYIHEYISDGRLIRIGGPEAEQFVPLTKQPDAPRYDIIVDQSPNAPDNKDKTWQAMMQLVPALLKAGLPIPPDLLDYAPFPAGLIVKWKKAAAQQQQQQIPEQVKGQFMQMQQEMQQLQQENQALKQNQANEAAAIQQKGHQAEAELVLKKRQQDAELAFEQAQIRQKMQLAEEEQRSRIYIANKKAETDAEIARIAARNKPSIGVNNG